MPRNLRERAEEVELVCPPCSVVIANGQGQDHLHVEPEDPFERVENGSSRRLPHGFGVSTVGRSAASYKHHRGHTALGGQPPSARLAT